MNTFETDYMTRNLCNYAITALTLTCVKRKNNAKPAGQKRHDA